MANNERYEMVSVLSSTIKSNVIFKLISVLVAVLLVFSLVPIQSIQFVSMAFADENFENVDDGTDALRDENNYDLQNEGSSDLSVNDSRNQNINEEIDSSTANNNHSYLSSEKNYSEQNIDSNSDSVSTENGIVDSSKYFSNASGEGSFLKKDVDFLSVSNYEQLKDAVMSNSAVNIILNQDIEIKAYDKVEIPSFCGTLDGNGHTIYSDGVFYVNTDNAGDDGPDEIDCMALFKNLNDGAKIINTKFDLNIEGPQVAEIAKNAYGSIEISDCTINGSVVGNNPLGSLFEWSENDSCAAGAICFAQENSNIKFSNVIVNAQIECSGDRDSTRYAGGLIAKNEKSNISVENCEIASTAEINAVGKNSIGFSIVAETFKFVAGAVVGGLISSWADSFKWSAEWNLKHDHNLEVKVAELQFKRLSENKKLLDKGANIKSEDQDPLQDLFNMHRNYYEKIKNSVKRQIDASAKLSDNVNKNNWTKYSSDIHLWIFSGDLKSLLNMSEIELDWLAYISTKAKVIALKNNENFFTQPEAKNIIEFLQSGRPMFSYDQQAYWNFFKDYLNNAKEMF